MVGKVKEVAETTVAGNVSRTNRSVKRLMASVSAMTVTVIQIQAALASSAVTTIEAAAIVGVK